MKLGVDLSTFYEEKAFGAHWYVKGEEVDPYLAFKSNGISYVRLRLWKDPYDEDGQPYLGGTCDFEKLLWGALKANSLGMEVVLDFHYSDFWCDPGKQTLPKSWEGLSLPEARREVKSYTATTLASLKEAGVVLHAIQIGNEITNGFLWPLGHLEGEGLGRSNFEGLATLLKAGVEGAREVCPEAKIILHLENSGNLPLIDEWYGRVSSLGVDFDVIGLSYYPYWHGPMDAFFQNTRFLRAKYGKPVYVMETGFAFTTEDYESEAKSAQLVVNGEVAKSMESFLPYPCTREGQRTYVRDFLKKAKESLIEEVYYWEPAWIPVKGAGWATIKGQEYCREKTLKEPRNEWANQILFDYEGRATPAFDEFKTIDGKE